MTETRLQRLKVLIKRHLSSYPLYRCQNQDPPDMENALTRHPLIGPNDKLLVTNKTVPVQDQHDAKDLNRDKGRPQPNQGNNPTPANGAGLTATRQQDTIDLDSALDFANSHESATLLDTNQTSDPAGRKDSFDTAVNSALYSTAFAALCNGFYNASWSALYDTLHSALVE